VARDEGGFVAGLVVGGLVGAALALLYTPRSGQETRRVLLERAAELSGQDPESLLERGRGALRARFQEAAQEAQRTANETTLRLEAEYRSAKQGESPAG
jgi:gas vesicle protein